MTVYRADPGTGALVVIQMQQVRGALPRSINLAPGGKWLLAAGADSNTVSVHRVNPEKGELIPFLPRDCAIPRPNTVPLRTANGITYQTKGIINVPTPICIVFAR